ncbi:hypothetical protein GGR43_004581 [Sphingobium jiangsuense]|uniref:Uncharacterized protein n=1 Tax=Sphingobium jiangsuense TaxID=870476 RepID=A0A7W6BPN5_9SPHN|nr:hypothetical protein [Sphingobium jiangsuense]
MIIGWEIGQCTPLRPRFCGFCARYGGLDIRQGSFLHILRAVRRAIIPDLPFSPHR